MAKFTDTLRPWVSTIVFFDPPILWVSLKLFFEEQLAR